MSKTKERVYTVTGVTNPLVDGKPRRVTLVGILTESSDVYPVRSYDEKIVKGKHIETITSYDEELYDARFAIGLSVLNPEDDEIASDEDGQRRARGRASKPEKALTTFITSDRFFGDDTAPQVLELQLKRIIRNPNKFIKVSPSKPAKTQQEDSLTFDEVKKDWKSQLIIKGDRQTN